MAIVRAIKWIQLLQTVNKNMVRGTIPLLVRKDINTSQFVVQSSGLNCRSFLADKLNFENVRSSKGSMTTATGIVYALNFVCQTLILCIFLYHCYQNPLKQRKTNNLRWLAFAVLVCQNCGVGVDVLYLFTSDATVDYSGDSTTQRLTQLLFQVSFFFYAISHIFWVSFLVHRMHQTFNNTLYQVSRKYSQMLLYSIALMVLLSLIHVAALILDAANVNIKISSINLSEICYVFFIVNLCISMILVLIMAKMFANRLLDLTLTVHQSLGIQLNVAIISVSNNEEDIIDISGKGDHSGGSNSMDDFLLFSDKQELLLSLISKQAYLAFVQAFAYLIFLVFFIVSKWAIIGQVLGIFVSFFLSLCGVIANAAIAIVLTFGFAQNEYEKLCKYCHSQFDTLYRNKAKRKLTDQYVTHIEMERKKSLSQTENN